LWLGRQRGLSLEMGQEIACQLARLPSHITRALALEPRVRAVAETYAGRGSFLYLGRGVSFPVALEGAPKLKELSYIQAQGDPAAALARAHHDPAAVAGVPPGGRARLRCGSPPQPRQERHGGMRTS